MYVRFFRQACTLLFPCLLLACTPFELIRSFGPDAIYTVSEDRSIDDVWEDNKLKLALNKAFLDDSASLFKDIGTVVYEGRVLLIGGVETPQLRTKAERIARRQEGVKSVVNRIQVTDQGGLVAYTQDVLIEKKIQAELLFTLDVLSANLRVRSVNLIVYLFGEAANHEEIARTIATARGVEEVRDVENLLWLRDGAT